jgi:hypothetical protein
MNTLQIGQHVKKGVRIGTVVVRSDDVSPEMRKEVANITEQPLSKPWVYVAWFNAVDNRWGIWKAEPPIFYYESELTKVE